MVGVGCPCDTAATTDTAMAATPSPAGAPSTPRRQMVTLPDTFSVVYGKTDRRKVMSIMGPSGRAYGGESCCCLAPTHRFRLYFIWLVEQKWLEALTLTVIIANSIVLAVQGPPNVPGSPISPAMGKALELTFTALFTAEMVIKIIAMGFGFQRGAYLSDAWNRLDFVVVVMAYLPLLIPSLQNMSAIRSLRALRPLRSLSVLPGVRKQAMTLIDSMPKLVDVIMLFGFSLGLFAVLGVQVFKGM